MKPEFYKLPVLKLKTIFSLNLAKPDILLLMTKKTLYIIRHGETDLNKAGIVQGRGMNTDLNETGRKQAESFFRAYKNVPFDKILYICLETYAPNRTGVY